MSLETLQSLYRWARKPGVFRRVKRRYLNRKHRPVRKHVHYGSRAQDWR